MLTETSYLYAIYTYVGAAVLALLWLGWWLSYYWRPGPVLVVVLVGAGLLLTPAYPGDSAETLAPALIVAGFQIFTDGVEAAEHALTPLATFSGIGLGLALLLWVGLLRGRQSRRQRRLASAQAAGQSAGQNGSDN